MPNRWTESHQNAKGAGDSRPTGIQIVDDEGLAGKLSDKVFLVTGVTSGIGVDTVDALAHTGGTVYAAARDVSKAQKALSHIQQPGKVELVEMDLTSFASVRKGAADFLQRSGNKLNVLVCNAGIMAVPQVEKTADGFESQFGTNHLAHFLLFQCLKDALLTSSTPEFSSRVVMVSSSGHKRYRPRVDSGDYNFDDGSYAPFLGYGQSKTANIWTANHIERLYGSKGLHANSLMPGGIATPLQKHVIHEEWMQKAMTDAEGQRTTKNTAQGAATSIWAAVGAEWEGKGGKYLENCDVAELNDDAPKNGYMGYKAYAYDEAGEKKLWDDSLKMVGWEK